MTTLGLSDGASKEKALRGLFIAGLIDVCLTTTAFLLSNSSILLADFLKTGIEFIAITLSWVAIRRINRGGGKTYEYGLGKLENISSLFVALVMLLSFLIITANAVRNIITPGHIAGIGLWVSIGSQIVYSGINGSLYFRTHRLSQESPSPLMDSQTRLFMTRFIGNVFILISLGLSMAFAGQKWASYIDPAASLVIALSVLSATLGIFSSSVYDLLDRTLEEERQIMILAELARHFNDFEELHGIRSRRSGSEVYVEIFLEFDPEKRVSQVQEAIDRLRHSIEEKIQGSRVIIAMTTEAIN
ncbi:MAG: cation diffusion facilitator family transporter [Verrucomicrobia bacterium]|nr:cation diffusion facilitator family transporter [Verrucomicrobiota bacterium]